MSAKQHLTFLSSSTQIWVLCALLNGCGAAEPKYVKYQPPREVSLEKVEEGGQEETPSAETSAQQRFEEAFEKPISEVCSRCHGSNHRLPLDSAELQPARERLLAFTKRDADRLFTFFETEHLGGDLSNLLKRQAVEAWLAAEGG